MAAQTPSPQTPTTLEARFAEAYPNLNSRRQALIRQIIDNPDETFYLSLRQLSKRLEVDPATTYRLIKALGYGGFPEFAEDLRRHFMQRVTPYAVMRSAAARLKTVGDHVHNSIDRDLHNLTMLKEQIDAKLVETIARHVVSAQHVLVVGLDFAASLAYFLSYALAVIGVPAEAPANVGSLRHRLRLLTRRDVLIGISFGRCLKETVEAVRDAAGVKVKTIAITDSDAGPLARYADYRLLVSINSPAFSGSYAAAMALLNALAIACSRLNGNRSMDLLRQAEREYESGERWYHE
ncbi:MAG: MurR/RpiR family transcriptional regulator [Steroidobacteraceae bacterium]